MKTSFLLNFFLDSGKEASQMGPSEDNKQINVTIMDLAIDCTDV